MPSETKKPCAICAGTGQRSYFKGESRFLLSWDECPACCGTGYAIDTTDSQLDRSAETSPEDIEAPPDPSETTAPATPRTDVRDHDEAG